MVSKRMKTTPAMACLKTLLSIFSIIFLIIGVAFLVAGIFGKVRFSTFDTLSTIDYSSAPWVMIAIGCFIIIVGVIGCCATLKGNTCLLRTYGLFLGLIFICELGGAIAAVVFRGQVDSSFHDGMVTALKKYSTDEKYKKAFDDAQTTMHCCGVENYTDWWTNTTAFKQNYVPNSCCKDKNYCKSHITNDQVNIAGKKADDVIYTTGCHALISSQINSNLAIIIGTMFGVAFFQLIGLILACCLASTINSNKYELV